jgi:hypothetical protein
MHHAQTTRLGLVIEVRKHYIRGQSVEDQTSIDCHAP